MNNRIQTLFKAKKENILSLYFTAGFPNLNDTLTILKHLEESDVDMIEIGFPYSDPLADGPVIQESSTQAIENGMTLALLFEQLKTLRNSTQKPIILMGYLNVVLQYGEREFIEKCAEVGVDGIIIPDMPLHYYVSNFKELCEKNQVSNILLVTPETSEERIEQLDRYSSGFIYLVSSNSITGSTNATSFQTDYYQRIQNMNLQNPHLIGFGVHNQKTFETVCQFGSGAIIGSAFINHLKENGTTKESINQFVNTILKT
ncbi:tryptophan synthase subunit alpha [Flavobacterium sp.]|uniref:tryptophan synthase subunit alpha n=1 Tax=Flavobacterium sp. TaxID=239 RepID=UPI002B4B7A93|nr:tryptophan synthase subunit alpha [Flavobacterium sp.]HLP64137.1 tryptophan synthase subunit alpha [Flavobacterium sp.]